MAKKSLSVLLIQLHVDPGFPASGKGTFNIPRRTVYLSSRGPRSLKDIWLFLSGFPTG